MMTSSAVPPGPPAAATPGWKSWPGFCEPLSACIPLTLSLIHILVFPTLESDDPELHQTNARILTSLMELFPEDLSLIHILARPRGGRPG